LALVERPSRMGERKGILQQQYSKKKNTRRKDDVKKKKKSRKKTFGSSRTSHKNRGDRAAQKRKGNFCSKKDRFIRHQGCKNRRQEKKKGAARSQKRQIDQFLGRYGKDTVTEMEGTLQPGPRAKARVLLGRTAKVVTVRKKKGRSSKGQG